MFYYNVIVVHNFFLEKNSNNHIKTAGFFEVVEIPRTDGS